MGSTCHLSDRLPRRDRLQDALMWFFTSAGRLLSCPFHGDAGRDFDVIDGGFRTKPALGLKELGYLSVAHRGWKLKHAPIPCLDTILLESPGFCDIHAGFFLGTNDVAHPDPQRCLFVWACRLVTAGKGFNNGFFRATHLRLFSAGFSIDFNASERAAVEGLRQASDPIP